MPSRGVRQEVEKLIRQSPHTRTEWAAVSDRGTSRSAAGWAGFLLRMGLAPSAAGRDVPRSGSASHHF